MLRYFGRRGFSGFFGNGWDFGVVNEVSDKIGLMFWVEWKLELMSIAREIDCSR